MKKVLVLALALIMILGMSSTAFAFDPVPKDQLKVGFIYVGDVVDLGYTYAHHQGTLAMQKALGLRDDQVLIQKNISEDANCETAIRELVDQGCQVIFGTSYGFMDYLAEAADEFPNVIFVHCSGDKAEYLSKPNFGYYFGRIWESRYLSGIAAGLKAKEIGNNKLGYVGAFKSVPEVVYSLDAYFLGARSVNPDVTMTLKETGSWYNPTAERQAADALLAEGCGILSQHVDTTGPVVAAEEKGAFAVGYNADMSNVAPHAYLTAPVWDWSVYVTDTVQKVIDGTWKPENSLMGLSEGLCGLAPLSANCAAGTQEAVDAAKAKILDGSLNVFSGPIKDNTGAEKVAAGQTLTNDEIRGITWFVDGITVG